MVQFIDHGLRGQLRSGSLLTGQLYLALDFFPDAPKVKVDTSKTPPQIPTIPGTFEELQGTLASIVKKLDKLQFEEIGADARKALASLDETLKDSGVLVKRLDADLMPELRRTLEDARKTLTSAGGVLATESPLQTDLRDALRELNRALLSIRTLADYLERHPESLLRGKQAE